jgi:A-factor type gamma-butyrolactone 1'-reductase (1S-forming)
LKVIAVNLRGTWMCVGREMAAMRAGGGSIVNVASIAGKRGFAGLSAYCASKHAVVGLTRAAALDGAASGVRVNAVLPGTTRTQMLDLQMETRPGGLQGTLQRIPLGRVAEASEQAEAIVWLLSKQSSFVTGECIAVDGGTTAKC